jgi:hypothetical protein
MNARWKKHNKRFVKYGDFKFDAKNRLLLNSNGDRVKRFPVGWEDEDSEMVDNFVDQYDHNNPTFLHGKGRGPA